ncbi:unnamed protein product [Lymnaea stagnalis]|uniref:Uncharacterized protein n=1 Tax=Lymnaea stagnalis TaxID=6523 RepID=A0AAV2HUX7_LYMST
MAVAAQNISTASFRINALDIAPRYSGFILALANTVAVAMSMTAPLVTSAVVYEGNREQWQTMFYVVAALSLAGGVAFMCLAKAKLQDWACDHQDDIKVGDDKTLTGAFIGHDGNGHTGNHVDQLTHEARQHNPAEKV